MDDRIHDKGIIEKALESQKWTFAKTMAKIPHEWVHMKTWRANITMPQIARYIQDYGYTKKFYNKEYKYLNVGGYCYWTMDFPLSKTDLINRAKI